MANKDLRDWLKEVEAIGELKVINGAEPKEEIGGIVDLYMRKMGNPAVLFDEVPDEKSSFSTRAVRRPREAASRATPTPVIPPPMTNTSNCSLLRRSMSAWRLKFTLSA